MLGSPGPASGRHRVSVLGTWAVEPARSAGWPPAAASCSSELGIDAYAARFPAALPYGIQKRTALARALMAEPSLLLLDEPASGLSDQEIDELAALIRT